MRRQRWWLPLVALVFVINWKSTLTLPVPDEELDTSPKLLGSSVVTSVSIVTGAPDNVVDDTSMKMSTADRRRVISPDLPSSPANFMTPDKFQFYTLNKEGNVVTKQMTEQEIQSLIAAGGGHLPVEVHEPQKIGDIPAGGMKVADVVQNVQNVLKGELNKPATVMTSVPTIPGHVNTEWSSILPAILGGESETASVSEPGASPVPIDINETPIIADTTSGKIPDSATIQTITTKPPAKAPESSATGDYNSLKRPTESSEIETHTEKPMIEVPVITVDQKLPSQQPEEDSMPVFQMLNTISADKINAQNNTHADEKPKPVETHHEEIPEKAEITVKPERLPVEPSVVKGTIIEEATLTNDKVPEMIEINYNSGNIEPSVIAHVVKPVLKPNSGIITSETISKLPESEPPATMTVISETHSTSMKVSGHEEIPLREPPIPIIEPADRIQEPTEAKKPEVVTEKSTIISTTDPTLDLTTLKVEATTEQSTKISTEHSLLAQGVSFFGDLPQTVSSIVSDIITHDSPNSAPIVEEAVTQVPIKTLENVDKLVGTTDLVKIPESTKSPAAQTIIGSIKETASTIRPAVNQEPVYQMMPEIVPGIKIPAPGTLPSEVSSIEHIIETLNDPTGSISGTVAADHFIVQKVPESQLNVSKVDTNQAEPPKTSNIPVTQTSTSARPINVETPVESSSVKPIEPLPTELADSLTSMIFQISDTIPAVLPLGQSAGLDTTEKKNVVNVNAEEAGAIENLKPPEVPEVSKIPEISADSGQFPVQAEPEKPLVVPANVSEIHQESTITTNADVKESTEKLIDTSSTELPTAAPVKTQSSNLDSSTTVKSAVPLAGNESSEVPLNRIEQVVPEKLEASVSNPEKSKPETDAIQASSDVTTDKIIPQALSQESFKIETTTETPATPIEKTSTMIPSGIITSSESSIASTVSIDDIEASVKVQTDSPSIGQEPLKLEDQKTEVPTQIKLDENNAELPIVHLDITEAKPTKFHKTNESRPIENADNGAESPLVRIKLTDPVALINSMIESSNVDVNPSPVVPLSLPETGSVPPNTIASGLIAGFPSSTTSATTVANPNSEANLTTVDPVKAQLEVQLLSEASVSNVTEHIKTSDVNKSEIQVENILKPETHGLEKENDVTEKIEIAETSTSKIIPTAAPEIPVERIDFPKEPVLIDSLKKATIAHVNLITQTSTDKPRIEEPITEITTRKSVEIEASTILATTAATSENQNTSMKLLENMTIVAEEPTTTKSASPIDEAPENRIKVSAPSVSQLLDSGDKFIEAVKIDEAMSVSAATKPDITTESTDIRIKNPELSAESINSTKSEAPDVRIDVAPEKLSEEINSTIQSTDLPIVNTTAASKKPLKDEGIQIFHTTQNLQSITTMQSPVESSEDNKEAVSNVSLQATTVSTIEKTTAGTGADENILKNDAKKPEQIETIAESTLSEKIAEPSSLMSAPPQTEEIRIRVNDTAVLVTKRPIADVSSQKLGDVKKSPENQPIEEQPTTPKVASVTEDPYVKLGEKIELPVPVKVSELSSSNEGSAPDTSVKKEVASASGTEVRIRLGDEQAEKIKDEKIPAKIDDTRKPIKKNSDSDSSSIEEKGVTPDLTTKVSSEISDETSAHQQNESNAQLSTKVEITTNASSNEPSNLLNISDSVQVQEKPIALPEIDTPIKIVTESPTPKPGKPAHKPTMNIKKDDTLPRPADDQWTLIPQQVYPALTKTSGTHGKRPIITEVPTTNIAPNDQTIISTERPPVSLDHPQSASGLDSTVKNLETDISYFVNLCNELAFTFWTATNKGLSTARSLAVSPFGMTSMLAMVFLGARGPTSDQMNDILKLDDVATFNPHLVFQNVTDAVGLARNQGIANAAFVRELFADRLKVRKLMPFYKEQAQQFYDGIVAEVNFATISDLVRRRTNLMIRKQTGGRIKDFVRTNTVPLRSPLAALSANVFQTDCNSSAASSEGRDGELYFAVSPAVRQRKLVPVPATVWRAGVLAGYEPSLDATAIALGGIDKLVSMIFVIPGQQGLAAPGDTLDRLETRVIRGATHDGSWNKLLKVLIPRPGLELQVPKFSHRSVINATAALKRMGLEELFSKHADLKGINGVATDLHLADVLQMNLFSTCGDENIISGRHHVEVYPGSPLRNAREYSDSEEPTDEALTNYSASTEDDGFKGSAIPYVPHRQARSARQNDATEKQRLKLDRPFLYFVRHNPTGLILHMGRFNPRLLP